MKSLVIIDQFGQVKELEITPTTFVPRIGESVSWSYTPNPKVVNVQYNYDEGTIFVAVG